VIGYGGVVYYLSSQSSTPVPGGIPDWILHPLEYLGFSVLLVRALNGGLDRPIPRRRYLLAILLAMAYAVSDEIHQRHVPRRDASVKDVLSDTLGAVLAVGVAESLHRVAKRRRKPALKVSLYTRRDCSLCHDARAILDRVAWEVPIEVVEVDIDSDAALARAYGQEVPVIQVGTAKISKLVPEESAIRRRLWRLATEAMPLPPAARIG
jgi:VanZ family protein/glutaredoxin